MSDRTELMGVVSADAEILKQVSGFIYENVDQVDPTLLAEAEYVDNRVRRLRLSVELRALEHGIAEATDRLSELHNQRNGVLEQMGRYDEYEGK